MFELPEIVNLAVQINKTLQGKTIKQGRLGNSPHKFVWYNRSHEEFEDLTRGKTIGQAHTQGRWLFLPVEPGYILLFGEIGGKMLYHKPGAKLPAKYHLYLTFSDESFFTATTQMWGAYELFNAGEEQNREYVKDMKPTPVDEAFTFEYFDNLIDVVRKEGKRSAKGLLTQDQIIPGLGNAIAQDILFSARLSPKHPIDDLNTDQRHQLYTAIQDTVQEIIAKGGRYDEYDLFGQPGKYERKMDKKSAGQPCPVCGTPIKKIQYLGGACYYCPNCQV